MSNSMADNIIGIYQRHAGAFEQKRSTTLFEQPWLERFLSLLPNNGRILILAAATACRSPTILSARAFR